MDVFALQASISLDTSDFYKSVQDAVKFFENLSKSTEDAGKMFESLEDSSEDTSKTFENLEDSAEDASKDIEKLEDAAKDAGQSTDKAGEKAKNAGKNIKSAGNDAKSAGGKFDSLKKSVSALDVALGSLIARGISAAFNGIKDFAVSMITTAAEVEAEKAQYEQAFKEIGDAAQTAFSGMSADLGIFDSRLKTVGTKSFTQFKGAGLEADEALVLMDKHMRIAADAAAYFDIPLEEADALLRSFERGNTEAGDSLLLFSSEAQRNTRALETYGKKWLDLTEAQKQMLMLDVAQEIYDQANITGQAARESENWANVIGNLQSVWRDSVKIIASPIKDALTPVVQKITDFLADESTQQKLTEFGAVLGDIAVMTFEGAMDFFDKLISGEFNEQLEGLVNIWDTASGFVGGILNFFQWLLDNQEALNVVVGVVVSLFAAMNPGAAVIYALLIIMANWESIKDVIDLAWQAVQDFFSITIPSAWNSFVQGIVDGWNSVVSWIQSAIDKVNEFLGIEAGAAGIGGGSAPWYTKSGEDRYATYNWLTGNGYATGLTRVPYDNFPALLHRDEAVLTRTQAADWRAGRSGNIDVSAIASAVYSAVVAGMSGVSVNMDSQRVGDMVTGRVSQNIAMAAWEGRYA